MAYEGCFDYASQDGRFFARGRDENGKRVDRHLADVRRLERVGPEDFWRYPKGYAPHEACWAAQDLTQGPHPVTISRHEDRASAREAARKFACSVARQAWECREADAVRDAAVRDAEQAKRDRDHDEARRGVGEADLFAGHGGPWE